MSETATGQLRWMRVDLPAKGKPGAVVPVYRLQVEIKVPHVLATITEWRDVPIVDEKGREVQPYFDLSCWNVEAFVEPKVERFYQKR